MVDEFEVFKARSYTGGADTTAILVTSSSRRKLSGPELDVDDDEDDDDRSRESEVAVTSSFRPRRLDWPAPSIEHCLTAVPPDGSTYRRHSAVGLPLADYSALQSQTNAIRAKRHREHRTSLTISKTDHKTPSSESSASGSGHLEISAAAGSWNMTRPRSGSWQGVQLELTVDDSTERRVQSPLSAASPEDVSLTGGGGSCGSGSGSRKSSECGSSSHSCSPKKGGHRSRHTSRGSPQQRVSSPTKTVSTTSPSVSISEPPRTSIAHAIEPPGSSDHLNQTSETSSHHCHQQQRSSIASLHPPVIHHVDENGQAVFKNVIVGSSGSGDCRRHGSSSSSRRNSSPPPSASRAAAAAGGGGRRNSAITYIMEVPTPSSSSLILSHSADKPHQSQQVDRRRRCSLQTGMLYTMPTGNEFLRSQFAFAKSMEADIDDIDDNAAECLLAASGRPYVDGYSEGLLGENSRCSLSGSGGDVTRSGRSPVDVVAGDLAAEVEVCRVAVYGGQQVGKTTMIDQLLTSEYLANRKEDSNGYRDDDNLFKSAMILLDGVECLVEFVEYCRVDDQRSFDVSIVVYSVTDQRTFDYARVILDQLLENSSNTTTTSSSSSSSCCLNQHGVVALVANKNDLVRNRVVSTAEGKKLISRQKTPHASVICQFIEVSALLDHRVDEVLTVAVRALRRQRAASLKRRRSSQRPPSHVSNHHRQSNSSWPPVAATTGLNERDEPGLDNRSVTSDSDNKCCIQRAAYAVLCRLIK